MRSGGSGDGTPGAMLQEALAGGKNDSWWAVARDDAARRARGHRPQHRQSLLETLDQAGLAEALGRLGPAEGGRRPETQRFRPATMCPHGRERWEFDPDLAREELARGGSRRHARRPRRGPEDARRSARPARCSAISPSCSRRVCRTSRGLRAPERAFSGSTSSRFRRVISSSQRNASLRRTNGRARCGSPDGCSSVR